MTTIVHASSPEWFDVHRLIPGDGGTMTPTATCVAVTVDDTGTATGLTETGRPVGPGPLITSAEPDRWPSPDEVAVAVRLTDADLHVGWLALVDLVRTGPAALAAAALTVGPLALYAASNPNLPAAAAADLHGKHPLLRHVAAAHHPEVFASDRDPHVRATAARGSVHTREGALRQYFDVGTKHLPYPAIADADALRAAGVAGIMEHDYGYCIPVADLDALDTSHIEMTLLHLAADVIGADRIVLDADGPDLEELLPYFDHSTAW